MIVYLIPGVLQPRPLYLRDPLPLPDLGPGLAADPNDPNTPPEKRLAEPSYALFLYPTPDDKYPDPALGEAPWTPVVVDSTAATEWEKWRKVLDDGSHQVTFEKRIDGWINPAA